MAILFKHLTDTYFALAGEALYGLVPRERLEPDIQAINREHPDADFVVTGGDLIHRGGVICYYSDTSPRFPLSSAEAEAAQTLAELAPHRSDSGER